MAQTHRVSYSYHDSVVLLQTLSPRSRTLCFCWQCGAAMRQQKIILVAYHLPSVPYCYYRIVPLGATSHAEQAHGHTGQEAFPRPLRLIAVF